MGLICAQFADLLSNRSPNSSVCIWLSVWGLGGEVLCLSTSAYLCCCRQMWAQARANLLRTGSHNLAMANHHQITAYSYRVGQKVGISPRDLPLHMESRKMAPHGPFHHPEDYWPRSGNISITSVYVSTFHVSCFQDKASYRKLPGSCSPYSTAAHGRASGLSSSLCSLLPTSWQRAPVPGRLGSL